MKKDLTNYKATPSEQLDALLEKQYGCDDDRQTTGHRSKGGAGVNKTYATTNWSNLNFVQLCIAVYDVLIEAQPSTKKLIDLFEFIGYANEVLNLRLLKQQEAEDIFHSTDKVPSAAVLESAVLPKPLVLFMESLAPLLSPDGTKMIFVPYEYRQVQPGGGHAHLDDGYALLNQQIVIRAARTRDVLSGHTVAQGAAAPAVRCNIYEMLREVENQPQGATITAANLNQWIGYPVFLKGYKKRQDRVDAFVVGQVNRQGTHMPQILTMSGTVRMCYNNPMFEDFNCESWDTRTTRMTSVQVYDPATNAFQFSLIERRSQVIVNPFIYLQAGQANIQQMLDAIGFPRYIRLRPIDMFTIYDKSTRLKDSMRTKDCSSMVQDIMQTVNMNF